MGGVIMTPFENAIKEYLDARAKEDVKFAEKYSNGKKSIEECCRFILGEMRKKAKSGMYGATDAEVFGLAVHYYDEEDIKVDKNVSAEVVINRELTEEEKQEFKKRKEAKAKTEEHMKEEDRKRREELKKRTAEDKKRKEQERKKKEQEEEGLLFLFDEEDL
ncbi:MAG: Cas9 inhibitor AcrIIA9 family protein [Bacteroidales bacterium]|nr:Cas9 inhibitor AcrIIA9 family protein [Bacteroidales bacterium]